MSREFGGGHGYFHDRIQQCVEDLESSQNENTRRWIPFFKEFHKVAYALSSFEAGDWSEAGYILQMIKSRDVLKQEFEKIEKHIDLYEDVIWRALEID